MGRNRSPEYIWISILDVAQLFVAATLIDALRKAQPDLRLLLLPRFPDFEALVRDYCGAEVGIHILPVQADSLVHLQPFPPRCLIVLSNALPLVLISACHQHKVPVYWLGAEVNQGDLLWADRPDFRRLIPAFKAVFPCSQTHRKRMLKLGFAAECLQVVGSLKADAARNHPAGQARARKILERAGFSPECPPLVASSIWPGEDRALCDILKTLRPQHPELTLLLAPRCREHYETVAATVTACGLSLLRYSRLPAAPGKRADVLLLDVEGELRHYFAWSRLAFIGRSLTHRPGSSMLEAAFAGRAMVVGPHMVHFQHDLAHFKRNHAVVQVRDAGELGRVLSGLLKDPHRLTQLGFAAQSAAEALCGTLARTITLLQASLEPCPPGSPAGLHQ